MNRKVRSEAAWGVNGVAGRARLDKLRILIVVNDYRVSRRGAMDSTFALPCWILVDEFVFCIIMVVVAASSGSLCVKRAQSTINDMYF